MENLETKSVTEQIDEVVTEAVEEILEEATEAKNEEIESVVEKAAEQLETAQEASEAIVQASILTTLGAKIETLMNESAGKWQDLENLKLQVASLTGEISGLMMQLSQPNSNLTPTPSEAETLISSPAEEESLAPTPEPPLEKPAPRRRWI